MNGKDIIFFMMVRDKEMPKMVIMIKIISVRDDLCYNDDDDQDHDAEVTKSNMSRGYANFSI